MLIIKLKKILKLIVIIISFLYSSNNLYSARCSDTLLLDGSEPVLNMGIDTTGHWWAITEPFIGQVRIIVDGFKSNPYYEVRDLKFSNDGNRWACFVRDNAQWYILGNDTLIGLTGTAIPGEIKYSADSKVICYSYSEAAMDYVVYGNKTARVYQRYGSFYTNQRGDRIAFTGIRGNKMVLIVHGKESAVFDEILPIGFWHDNTFLYAVKNGGLWEIYKNNEPITETFTDVFSIVINNSGTTAAFLARRMSNDMISVLISDDYYEPLVSKSYDQLSSLILHPTLPMIAYKAKSRNSEVVVYNSTEYQGGKITGIPQFTCDGSEMLFTGCDIDCFVNIDGRKYSLNTELSTEMTYAKKPGSPTIAYSTNAALVVRHLEQNELYAGKMVDSTIQPIYNWRTGNYEALGFINNRIYKLVCKF